MFLCTSPGPNCFHKAFLMGLSAESVSTEYFIKSLPKEVMYSVYQKVGLSMTLPCTTHLPKEVMYSVYQKVGLSMTLPCTTHLTLTTPNT